MKGKTSPNASAVQPDQDRESMTQEESREALIMALNNLLQALHTLRASLLSLQAGLSAVQKIFPLTLAPAPVKGAPAPRLDLLKKPRILH